MKKEIHLSSNCSYVKDELLITLRDTKKKRKKWRKRGKKREKVEKKRRLILLSYYPHSV